MRLNVARKVGSRVSQPSIVQSARSKARPQQRPEYGPTDSSAKTKATDNRSDIETTNSEPIATECAQSPLIDDQPRVPAAFTSREWFHNRLLQFIRGVASKEVAALQEYMRLADVTNIRRAQLDYEPLQNVPPVLSESEKSLHVVRLLHALKQWESRRFELRPRQKRRLESQCNLFSHIRLALDSSQVQPDATADTIFLFGRGLVEILKAGTTGHTRGPDFFKSGSSGPYCIEILTHLVQDINTQLAEDINNVTSTKGGLRLSEDGSKILFGSKSGLLSPGGYDKLLATFSSTLQHLIRNGLLYDTAEFQSTVWKEKPRAEMWDALASLMDHELSRPRKPKERQYVYEARRAKVLANAMWIRHQNAPRVKRQKNEATAKLKMMFRSRDYHLSRLRLYQGSRNASIGTERRITQIKTTIDEITRAILHLQSSKPDTQSISQRETGTAGSSTMESIETAPVIDTSIEVKPVSLSDSMIFQLSRELLDGFNEAAYIFGQQYAPAMMRKGGWTGPEKIDLPLFISSFHLDPKLSGQLIRHQEVFNRLREFRNNTAHGGGNMTMGDISSSLSEFATAARFFRSSGWAAQIESCRTLLRAFTASQHKHLKEAYEIVRPFTKRLRAELKESKPESKGGESAPDGAKLQSAASIAAKFKEAWADTEQSLLQLDSREITRFVGQAQIRRILRNMGPDASAVLTELQKEQAGRPDEASITPGVQEIFNSLSEKLTQSEAQRANLPHVNAKANNSKANPAIGADGLMPELPGRIPPGRTAFYIRKAQQQREDLRQMANKVRMNRAQARQHRK